MPIPPRTNLTLRTFPPHPSFATTLKLTNRYVPQSYCLLRSSSTSIHVHVHVHDVPAAHIANHSTGIMRTGTGYVAGYVQGWADTHKKDRRAGWLTCFVFCFSASQAVSQAVDVLDGIFLSDCCVRRRVCEFCFSAAAACCLGAACFVSDAWGGGTKT